MELRIDADKWRRKRGVGRLLDALGAEDGLTRYVGGAVRDELLGLPHSDSILQPMLRPEDVVQRLEAAKIRAVPTGIEHGTITAVSSGHPFEITSLTTGRFHGWPPSDRRIHRRLAGGRRPPRLSLSMPFGRSARRATSIDYFGGKEDLLARRVRFIGDPLERIAEDHLRILRFFRFHARFGEGEPDRDALEACSERANDLMALSRERIADETSETPVRQGSVTDCIDHARPGHSPTCPPRNRSEAIVSSCRTSLQRNRTRRIQSRSVAAAGQPTAAGSTLADRVAVQLKLPTKRGNGSPARRNRSYPAVRSSSPISSGSNAPSISLLLAGRARPRCRASAKWQTPQLPISGGRSSNGA